ncbi:MAG: hypothetical protein HKN23_15145 [Verrucomicrobiales bacterium]|nr:hypothetical protein [Verrucomicrobiales bacterium]
MKTDFVHTSCIDRLAPRDFQFIEEIFPGDHRPETLHALLADREMLVALLDHNTLFQAVIDLPMPLAITPQLYFFVLVRKSFTRAGIEDVDLADYVAATLAGHASGRSLGSAPVPGDRPDLDFTYHVDFIESMTGLSDSEQFFLHVQCGNHFLVLTGLFPNFLDHRAERRGAPGLNYYENVARTAFLIAADHPLACEFDLNGVYPRLADSFRQTRQALNHLADDYLFLGS